MQIDTTKPVLLTGATGYVAGWIAKELLDAGLTVHAAVRDPSNEAKISHLTEAAANAPGSIRFFKADLLDEGSYDEAMQGCGVVFHTASPFTINVKDPQKELIDPAVNGTRTILEAATRTESVHRVVVTSSVAAIYTDAIECQHAPGGVLTEDIWNTTASIDYQPYSYSKLLAEQEAWKIAGTQDRFDVVTINPSLVIGPALNGKPTSESFNIIRQMGDGTMKMGAPELGLGAVDVRDLGKAHVAAGFTPQAKGRYIVSGYNTSILELGKTLIEKYGSSYPLPRKPVPKWLAWLLAPIMNGIPRKYISNNVGIAWNADNSKGRKDLGITYRPLKETMEDMFQQMIDVGAFKK